MVPRAGGAGAGSGLWRRRRPRVRQRESLPGHATLADKHPRRSSAHSRASVAADDTLDGPRWERSRSKNLVVQGVNSMTFVAPNLAWGEARGGSIPRQWGCDRRATKPQAKFDATLRAAVLFGPGGVARSSQTAGVCSSLAPCLGRKLLAANVTVFTPWTTWSLNHEPTRHSRCFFNVARLSTAGRRSAERTR